MGRINTMLMLLSAMLLAACAATGFNLPGVAPATDGSRQPGMVIWHDLLSDTPDRSQAFYSELFDWEFEPLPLANYTLIRHRGRLIGGMVDQNQLPTSADISQWVVVMSVADIDASVDKLESAGGRVFTPPTPLGERGEIAVVADRQGAVLALLQTRDGDPSPRSGTPPAGDFLWNELWSPDPGAAAAFYRDTVGYAVELRELDGGGELQAYRLLKSGGVARAGLRERPAADVPPMWVSYLRVADSAALDAILARVESLGGRILVPATDRPAGGRVAVIADPSGAGIALQTWDANMSLGKARAASEVMP